MSFENDARRGEMMLHELALELRNVPVDGRTQALHVRALQLKRDVTHWWREPRSAEERARVLDELDQLRTEAVDFQSVPSGRELVARRTGTF